MGFILDSLRSLDEDLREKGSQLFVVKGDPLDVIERFIQEFQVYKTSLRQGRLKEGFE